MFGVIAIDSLYNHTVPPPPPTHRDRKASFKQQASIFGEIDRRLSRNKSVSLDNGGDVAGRRMSKVKSHDRVNRRDTSDSNSSLKRGSTASNSPASRHDVADSPPSVKRGSAGSSSPGRHKSSTSPKNLVGDRPSTGSGIMKCTESPRFESTSNNDFVEQRRKKEAERDRKLRSKFERHEILFYQVKRILRGDFLTQTRRGERFAIYWQAGAVPANI